MTTDPVATLAPVVEQPTKGIPIVNGHGEIEVHPPYFLAEQRGIPRVDAMQSVAGALLRLNPLVMGVDLDFSTARVRFAIPCEGGIDWQKLAQQADELARRAVSLLRHAELLDRRQDPALSAADDHVVRTPNDA